jgi:hypothetical protein
MEAEMRTAGASISTELISPDTELYTVRKLCNKLIEYVIKDYEERMITSPIRFHSLDIIKGNGEFKGTIKWKGGE